MGLLFLAVTSRHVDWLVLAIGFLVVGMALPIDALIEPLTEEQVKASIYSALAAVGINTSSWRPRSTTRAILAVIAVIIAGFTRLMAAAIRGTILEYATGVWLTVLAKYVFGVERIAATFAETTVTLTNSGGGIYSADPGEMVFYNTAKKTSYINVGAVSLGALATVDVLVRAVEAGSGSTATPGQIDSMVTPWLGVTVTNPSPAVGLDEQTDPSLRADCAAARGALSPYGAGDAYRYFSKRVPGGATLKRADGSEIGVDRVQVVTDPATGEVTVYVVTTSGPLDPSDLDLVDANLKKYAVPGAVTEVTANANEVPITVLYSAYARADGGKSTAELKALIDANLTAYFTTFPLGGETWNGTDYYAFLDVVKGIIIAADPALFKVILSSPLADTAMIPGDWAKLTIAGGSSVSLVNQ